jgi:hypothetical protein
MCTLLAVTHGLVPPDYLSHALDPDVFVRTPACPPGVIFLNPEP